MRLRKYDDYAIITESAVLRGFANFGQAREEAEDILRFANKERIVYIRDLFAQYHPVF